MQPVAVVRWPTGSARAFEDLARAVAARLGR
jgi:hypothetical protein